MFLFPLHLNKPGLTFPLHLNKPNLCVYLEPTFFFYLNVFQGLSKMLHKTKENNTVSGQIFKPFKALRIMNFNELNWPSHLVNNVSCKFTLPWYKVREIFLVSGGKKH